jgi:hypothetical protein
MHICDFDHLVYLSIHISSPLCSLDLVLVSALSCQVYFVLVTIHNYNIDEPEIHHHKNSFKESYYAKISRIYKIQTYIYMLLYLLKCKTRFFP